MADYYFLVMGQVPPYVVMQQQTLQNKQKLMQ